MASPWRIMPTPIILGVLILFAATAAEMAPHTEGLGARLTPTNPSHVATAVNRMLLSSEMKPD